MLSLLLTAVFLAGGAMTSQVYAGNSAVPDVKSSAKCSLTITVAAHDHIFTDIVRIEEEKG